MITPTAEREEMTERDLDMIIIEKPLDPDAAERGKSSLVSTLFEDLESLDPSPRGIIVGWRGSRSW